MLQQHEIEKWLNVNLSHRFINIWVRRLIIRSIFASENRFHFSVGLIIIFLGGGGGAGGVFVFFFFFRYFQ